MDRKLAAKILIIVSMAYGITLALLAVFEVSAMTTVAIVGALVLGLLWVAVGMFSRQESGSASES